MNDKVTMQELIDLFAAKNGLSQKDADLFVRTFFGQIEEALAREKYVKIKGLGTFKLTEVDRRESIDVNTGERIEIQGHTKISFVPDTALKELINKPFSHFETVILNEGTQLEDTPVVSADELARENEEGTEDEVVTETATATSVESAESVSPAPGDEASTTEPSVAEVSVPEASVAETAEAAQTMEVEPAQAAVAEPSVAEASVAAQPSESAQGVEIEPSQVATESTEAAPQPSQVVTESAEASESTETVAAQPAQVATDSSQKKEKTVGEKNISSGELQKNTWKVVSIVLAILLVVLLVGGFFYYQHMQSKQSQLIQENESLVSEVKEQLEAETAVLSAGAQDSHAQTRQGDAAQTHIGGADGVTDIHLVRSQQGGADGSQSASGEATDASKNGATSAASDDSQNGAGIARLKLDPEKTYRITGTQGTHTLRSGESLVRIAVKYFGAKDFWPYIAEHNQGAIKDADRVPIGTELKIPVLQEVK